MLDSGSITNPAISVYNTVDGTPLFLAQTLDYAHTQQGTLRYNNTTFLTVSGEPYLVETSGTIDSAVRSWKLLIGLDNV